MRDKSDIFNSAKQFIDDYGFRPIVVEMPFTSNALQLGGTVDSIGRFSRQFWSDDKKFWHITPHEFDPKTLWIADWKITGQVEHTAPLQGYGYKLLAEEKLGLEINYFAIVRFEKDETEKRQLEVKGFYLPDYKGLWDSTRHLYDYLNKQGSWKILRRRKYCE